MKSDNTSSVEKWALKKKGVVVEFILEEIRAIE